MYVNVCVHHGVIMISDTALKVFRSLYYFTTSICHGVGNYFPRLWGTGISDAIFTVYTTSPTNEVKNLGFTFDSGDTFASHITRVDLSATIISRTSDASGNSSVCWQTQ